MSQKKMSLRNSMIKYIKSWIYLEEDKKVKVHVEDFGIMKAIKNDDMEMILSSMKKDFNRIPALRASLAMRKLEYFKLMLREDLTEEALILCVKFSEMELFKYVLDNYPLENSDTVLLEYLKYENISLEIVTRLLDKVKGDRRKMLILALVSGKSELINIIYGGGFTEDLETIRDWDFLS